MPGLDGTDHCEMEKVDHSGRRIEVQPRSQPLQRCLGEDNRCDVDPHEERRRHQKLDVPEIHVQCREDQPKRDCEGDHEQGRWYEDEEPGGDRRAEERRDDQKSREGDPETNQVRQTGNDGEKRSWEPHLVRQAGAVDDGAHRCRRGSAEIAPADGPREDEGRVRHARRDLHEVGEDDRQHRGLEKRYGHGPHDPERRSLVADLEVLASQHPEHRAVLPDGAQPLPQRSRFGTNLQHLCSRRDPRVSHRDTLQRSFSFQPTARPEASPARFVALDLTVKMAVGMNEHADHG